MFSQKNAFGETFSKITIKVPTEVSFSKKPAKSEMLRLRHVVTGLKPLNYTSFYPSGRKSVQGNKFIFGR